MTKSRWTSLLSAAAPQARNNQIVGLAALLMGVSMPSMAYAQSAASPATTANAETNSGQSTTGSGIEEITVTARRRSENARDVPISLVAVQGGTLAARNIVQQQDLSVYVPSLRVDNAAITPVRMIRGAGSGQNLSFDQAVGTFFDGIYEGRPQLARVPFFDLERVEVLRGPQVILFGNSTTAGAVNVTTRKPTDRFELDASSSYEIKNEELILRGGVTAPIADGISLRVAGFSQTLDKGWQKALTSGSGTRHDPRFDNQGVRATLVVKPASDVTFTAKFEKDWLGVLGNTLQAISNSNNLPYIYNAELGGTRIDGSPPPFGFHSNSGVPQDVVKMTPRTYFLNSEWAPGPVTVTATTAWLDYDFLQQIEADLSPLPILDQTTFEHYRQFSQELRLSGNVAKIIDYQIGGYYQRDHLFVDSFTDSNLGALGYPLPPASRAIHFNQRNRSWSLFGDFTVHVTDQFQIGVGARYSDARKLIDQSQLPANVGTWELNPTLAVPFGIAFGTPHSFNNILVKEHHFQPQVIVQYKLSNDVTFFAKAVRGDKAGGYDYQYSGSDPNGGRFLPERATSYEAGVKALLLDRKLSADLTIFRTDFDNLQVTSFAGGTNFVVGNAAQSRSQGVELETIYRPITPLTLSVSVSYLDAKYVSFRNANCYYEQKAATPTGQVCVQDLSGKPTPLSTKWSGVVGAEYRQPIGEKSLTGQVNVNFRSSGNVSYNNDPAAQRPAFALVDARLTLAGKGERWTLTMFGKNLTDKLYTDFISDVPLAPGARDGTSNRGRQIGFQVGVKF